MEEKISQDIADEVKFLTEQNVADSVISQMLGVSLDSIDRIRIEDFGHLGLGRIRSART